MEKVYFRDAKGCKIFTEVSNEVAEAMTEHRRAEWRGDANAKNHNVSLQALEEAGVSLRDNTTNPLYILIEQEEAQEHADKLRKLKTGLSALPRQQRLLLRELYIENKTLKEIAQRTSVSYQAVQNRLKKILEKLRKYFD